MKWVTQRNKKTKQHLSLFLSAVFVFSTLVSFFAPIAPTASASAEDLQALDNGITKLLYRNAMATCFAYSPLRNNSGLLAQKDNIDESNAAAFQWFNDSPAMSNSKWPLDVFAGRWLKEAGSTSVDDYGKASCSNPTFIKEALGSMGYNTSTNDPVTVFSIMCEIGFRRSGGDGCLSGNGSWKIDEANEDKRRDNFLSTPKAAAIGNLTNAQAYRLLYLSFINLCDVTVTDKTSANLTQDVADIIEFNENGDPVTRLARWGDNKKSLSVLGPGIDLYSPGITTKTSTNYPPGTVSAGGQISGSVRLGDLINGCAGFAQKVNVYADDFKEWLGRHPGTTATPPAPNNGGVTSCSGDACPASESQPTCLVDGIGWIVCPVVKFLGGIVDAAYGFVDSLLKVEALYTTGDSQPTYNAWVVMRNIANIAFVIVFLIIIFSQLTSMGVSNYGVKKMLPRLVIAAILVNVSYWICAIAIDLSNILGSSMRGLFDSVGASITVTEFSQQISQNNGAGWEGMAAAILVGGAGVALYIGLSAFIPAVLAAALAIITVFLVLTLRQALIILLIVISPLAFIAYILPNTEDLFTKWRKLLTTLLLMYPIIAGIFGASTLASQIVMNSADGPYTVVIQIMGALISILPLAITPIVMKTAGGLLGQVGGMINNAGKQPVGSLRKAGEGYRKNRQNLRDMRAMNGASQFGRGTFVRWRARRKAIGESYEAGSKRAEQSYIASQVADSEGKATAFGQQMAGGKSASASDIQRVVAGAKFTLDKVVAEEVKAEEVMVANLDKATIATELSSGNNSAARTAALLDRLVKVGDPSDYAAHVDRYGNDKSEENKVVRQTLARSLNEYGPKVFRARNLDDIATGSLGGTTMAQIAKENVAEGILSQEKMAEDSSSNLRYAWDVSDNVGRQRMVNTAAELRTNETLKGKIKHNAQSIENMATRGLRP